MPITSYENDPVQHKPKMLEGMIPLQAYAVQVADERGKPMVLIGFDLGQGKMSFMAPDTWSKMGPPAAWLKPQLDAWFAARNKDVAPVPEKKSGEVKKVQDLGGAEV